MQARCLRSQWRSRTRLALLRPGRLVQTSFRASRLSLLPPLELLLRVLLLEGEIERLLDDLRHVSGSTLNTENLGEPFELRSTGLSVMPVGLEETLDPEKMRDLVEFLRRGLVGLGR